MPLLNHLICQGHIMVRATCRTADQTPSRISGERSVTQNKLLETPTSLCSGGEVHVVGLHTLNYGHAIYLCRCMKVNKVALHWLRC